MELGSTRKQAMPGSLQRRSGCVFHKGTIGDCHQDLWSCDNGEESTSEQEKLNRPFSLIDMK